MYDYNECQLSSLPSLLLAYAHPCSVFSPFVPGATGSRTYAARVAAKLAMSVCGWLYAFGNADTLCTGDYTLP